MRAQTLTKPQVARSYDRLDYELPDGLTTTLHIASFERAAIRVRVGLVAHPSTLLSWCRSRGVADAVVGGFFVRPHGTPLGELRIDGAECRTVPFERPWDQL